jgi:hypothetical protein
VAASRRSSDEETRAYLQARISVYAMLVLVSIVGEIALLSAWYTLYPSYRPWHGDAILIAGAGALVALALVWRVVLARIPL